MTTTDEFTTLEEKHQRLFQEAGFSRKQADTILTIIWDINKKVTQMKAERDRAYQSRQKAKEEYTDYLK